MRRFGGRWALFSTAIVVAVLAFPLGILASHQFGDVPDSNDYHADIDALADSGVTVGCGGGNYCPSAFVTREQMAAFMNRLGALAAGKTPVVNATKVDGLDSTQFVRSDVSATGHTSCIGSMMTPEFGDMDWFVDGSSVYPTAGDNWFVCQLHFPEDATITSFSGYFRDNHITAGARCELRRTVWEDGTASAIAEPDATGDAFTSAYVVKSTTTISEPTVDNALYSYWAECLVDAFDGTIALHGVTAAYTFTGLPEE